MTAIGDQVSAYHRGADFQALWDDVLAEPQNDERHQRFIRFAVLSQRHLEAADRYQEMMELGDEYEPIVEKYQRALALQVAAQTMARTPTKTIDRRRARLGWVLIGTGLAITAGLFVTKSLVALVGPVALFVGVIEVRQARG